MIGFYQITERLYDLFVEHGFNTITLDDEQDIDLKRQSIYPLAHIVPMPSTYNGNTNTFSFLLMVLDITDFNKKNKNEQDLMFYGIDNRQDILHSLFEKLRNVIEDLYRGDSFSDMIQTALPIGIDPIVTEFDNGLTGWTAQISITVPSEGNIC